VRETREDGLVARSGPLRVIFVAGAGRSGSTLLDRLLGAAPGVRSVGELRHVWRFGFLEDEFCGCGQAIQGCDFWADVFRGAFGGFEGVNAEMYDRRQERLLRARNVPWLAALALMPPRAARAFERWAEVQQRLFDAIAEASGCEVIVDSSKNPAYGLLLAGLPGIDLRVIHLVRDSRAVAYSWATRVKPHPLKGGAPQFALARNWQAGAWWLIANAFTEAARPLRRRYLRVRYEALARRPESVMEEITRFAGVEPVRPTFVDHQAIFSLGVHHSVGGNPMRFDRGAIAVRPDREWRTAMDQRNRRFITAMTWPLLLRYGYLSRH
jgi:hypothetical protein